MKIRLTVLVLLGLLMNVSSTLHAEEVDVQRELETDLRLHMTYDKLVREAPTYLALLPDAAAEQRYLVSLCQASSNPEILKQISDLSDTIYVCGALGGPTHSCRERLPSYEQERQRLIESSFRYAATATVLWTKYQTTPDWLQQTVSTPPCGPLLDQSKFVAKGGREPLVQQPKVATPKSTPSLPLGPYQVTRRTRLFQKPKPDAEVLTWLEEGRRVRVVGSVEDQWLKIESSPTDRPPGYLRAADAKPAQAAE